MIPVVFPAIKEFLHGLHDGHKLQLEWVWLATWAYAVVDGKVEVFMIFLFV